MIRITHKGNFDNTEQFFNRMLRRNYLNILARYGEEGLSALREATPKDSGVTAESWSYTIENDGKTVSISFNNSSENNGVSIVVLLMYGHGTKNGGYVQANDFVNPALDPVFKSLADAAWKEVTR